MTRTVSLLWLFFSLAPGWAGDDDVGAARAGVLSYLERLRDEKKPILESLELTVVSPFLGAKRRESLEDRLFTIRRDWIEREIQFKILSEKLDKDFGVVLVEGKSSHDPLAMEVIGFGVQRKKGAWRPAPVPGGFESVFLGFDDVVERRVAELERWLSAERVRMTKKLKSEWQAEFRKVLEGSRPESLAGDDPKAVVQGFLEVCRQRNLPATLACLEEMDLSPDLDWMEAKDVAVKGLRNQDRQNQWRFVTDPLVYSLLGEVDRDEDEATVNVLFFDPRDEGGVSDLRFDLRRGENRWIVDLPPELRYADVSLKRFRGLTRMGREGEGDGLFTEFRERFETLHAPVMASDLDGAGEVLCTALRDDSMVEILRMVTREDALLVREWKALYKGAAKLWVLFQATGVVQEPVVVGAEESGKAGVLALSRLEATLLDWVQLVPVHVMEEENGWVIAPGVVAPGNFDGGPDSLLKDQAAAQKAYDQSIEVYRERALPSLIGSVARLGDLAEPSLGEEVAVKLVKEFRELLTKNQPMKALDRCAVVDQKDGVWAAMKAITYSARGARHADGPDKYILTKASGPWVAVSVRVSSAQSEEPHYLMYLIGPTERGPRLIADIDLRFATNKGRAMLNEESLARLGGKLNPEQLALVKTLFQGHIEMAQTHFEEWQKNTKSSP